MQTPKSPQETLKLEDDTYQQKNIYTNTLLEYKTPMKYKFINRQTHFTSYNEHLIQADDQSWQNINSLNTKNHKLTDKNKTKTKSKNDV